MIIDEEVRAALDTLRRHAQGNGFELHRIDVLERDLTAPPVAEQIDEKLQKFNGRIYRKNAGGHYTTYISIHQVVWRYYHGDIPEGYEIHHDNENKADNSIVNLKCLTKAEHRSIHKADRLTDTNVTKTFVCAICGKEFNGSVGSKNLYCEACAESHPNELLKEKKCPHCGKLFFAKHYNQKYCSRQCGFNARSQRAIITRQCPVCGKEFSQRESDHNQACSSECGHKLSSMTLAINAVEKICPICGGTFIPKTPLQIYCSVKCRETQHVRQKRAKNSPRKCVICGKEFRPIRPSTKTCSRECKTKYLVQRLQCKRQTLQPELPFGEPSNA